MKFVSASMACALAACSVWWPTACAAIPVHQATANTTTTPAPVKLLKDDLRLQVPVTLDVVEQPLGDVLDSLNPTLKLDLSAEQKVADQRITLHVVAEPLYVMMGQLVALLSHDPAHPHGYHWGPLDLPAGSRTDYQLWRDANSVAEEQAALDAPRRRLAGMLRDMWTATQRTDPADHNLYDKALRSLSDDQIEALADGETIPLDPTLFTTEIADIKQASRVAFVELSARCAAKGWPAPSPPTDPPLPALQVIPADQDFDYSNMDRAGIFDLHVVGLTLDSLDLDANSTPVDPDPKLLPLPPDTGPHVDLSPYLAGPGVTPQQQGDLGLTLQALGKAAHLNILQESFLGTNTEDGLPHPGLNTLRGSVPRLVAQICVLWNYRAVPIPGGYLFWSRTWAQDRARDVPERLIAPWRKRLAKNGALSLYDRAEIDADLTWPQVSLTLAQVLPEAGDSADYGTYRLLNVFGSLTPDEQAQALLPDGLPLAEMSVRGQEVLVNDYQDRFSNIPSDQIAQAIFRFSAEEAPAINDERLALSLNVNGQTLLDKWGAIPLKPGKIGSPTSPIP
jgi:hypothetical protein